MSEVLASDRDIGRVGVEGVLDHDESVECHAGFVGVGGSGQDGVSQAHQFVDGIMSEVEVGGNLLEPCDLCYGPVGFAGSGGCEVPQLDQPVQLGCRLLGRGTVLNEAALQCSQLFHDVSGGIGTDGLLLDLLAKPIDGSDGITCGVHLVGLISQARQQVVGFPGPVAGSHEFDHVSFDLDQIPLHALESMSQRLGHQHLDPHQSHKNRRSGNPPGSSSVRLAVGGVVGGEGVDRGVADVVVGELTLHCCPFVVDADL